jgi:metabotropic X receptor
MQPVFIRKPTFLPIFQYLDRDDDTRCLSCPLGTLPDVDHLDCIKLPEDYLKPTSHWAIGAIAFALCGIITNIFVLCVYMRYNDTPVVRASGRELSYVLLMGTLSCYIVTFLLVVRPTNAICALQEFSIGTCFSVVYGALLTKTNR